MFDVKVVCLVEELGQDQKYGIWAVDRYGAISGKVCNWHQNVFNLMSSLTFS